jgi:hypothetical protein
MTADSNAKVSRLQPEQAPPPPDWQPVPAWAPPPGRLWVHRDRVGPLIALALGIFLFGVMALLFWVAIAAQNSGGSLDPTDPANFNSYALKNDSGGFQYVHACADSACRKLDDQFDWVAVNPAAIHTEEAAWGTEKVAYAVSNNASSEGGYRCLFWSAAKKISSTTTIPLSQATTCR